MVDTSNKHIYLKSKLQIPKIWPFKIEYNAKIDKKSVKTCFPLKFLKVWISQNMKNIYEMNPFGFIFNLTYIFSCFVKTILSKT